MVAVVTLGHAAANSALAPMRKVPLLTACTTKSVIVPSISVALLRANKSAKLITNSPSSVALGNAEEKLLKVGASLTAVTLIVCVALPTPAKTSVAVKATVRAAVLGASLLLANLIACAVLCTKALVAWALKVNCHAVPALTLVALAVPICVVLNIKLLLVVFNQIPPPLIVAKLSWSCAVALVVICTFKLPPFQSVLPFASLILIVLATNVGVCSVKVVVPPAVTIGATLSLSAMVKTPIQYEKIDGRIIFKCKNNLSDYKFAF